MTTTTAETKIKLLTQSIATMKGRIATAVDKDAVQRQITAMEDRLAELKGPRPREDER